MTNTHPRPATTIRIGRTPDNDIALPDLHVSRHHAELRRSRDPYIRFNAEGFPYDWHLTVQRIVGEGQHAASWIEITGPGGSQPGLCFFDLADDGKIALITDFWPEPYELPASRAHLVERY